MAVATALPSLSAVDAQWLK